MLQCVAVCCSVLQRAFCSVLSRVLPQTRQLHISVLQCVVVRCSVLQFVAVCCNVLQYVVVGYSVLQCVAVCCRECFAVY